MHTCMQNLLLPLHACRYSRFILPEGVQKVEYQRDEKVPDAGSFQLFNEDHTIGNLARMQLHEDRCVVFAGYRIPHPLESKLVIMIQTNGQKTPAQAMDHALDDLRSEFGSIQAAFEEEVQRSKGGGYMQY